MLPAAPSQQSPGTGGSPSKGAVPEPPTGISLKRILDDDIQFVSEKPVKKQRRAASEDAAIQGKSTKTGQKPAPPLTMSVMQPPADLNPDGQMARPASQEERRRSVEPAVQTPPKSHTAPPELEPRGVSLPAMDSFAFPQTFTGLLADACQVSPHMSPKQLPQGTGPPLLRLPFPQQYLEPLPYPDMFNLEGAFSYLSAIPQNHPPMAPEAAFSQNALNPGMLMLNAPLSAPDERPHPESNLMTLAQAAQYTATPPQESPPTPPAIKTSPGEQSTTQMDRQLETAERLKDQMPADDAIKTSPTSPPAMTQQEVPPPPNPQPQGGPVQPVRPMAVPKGPCLICARLREQACLSNAHGIPLPGMPQGLPLPPTFFHHPLAMPTTGGHLRGVGGSPHPLRHLNSPLDIASLVSPSPSLGPSTSRTPAPSQPTPPLSGAPSPCPAAVASTAEKANTPPAATRRPATAAVAPKKPTAAAAATATATTVVTAAAARLGPGADIKRKQPAPNLYVDIAETCLEIFPYAEVARRHAVSRQRVMDVFAAVIQLPLLRCPTDKRRVGKLGITRMKELNKAKKDLQAEKAAATAAAAANGALPSSQGGRGDTSTSAAPARAGQAAPPPNLYEVAQFMGPLDPPEPMKHGFPGPW